MSPGYFDADWSVLLPAATLAVGGVVALLLEAFGSRTRNAVHGVSLAALALSALTLYVRGGGSADPAADALASEVGTDLLALALAPVFYLAAAGALVLGWPYLRRRGRQRGEFQALVLFSTAGMVLLAQARDLLVLFLALETLSIPLYVLAGFFTDRERSVESALKYFTVGAFSSAFVALGIGLTLGATGTLSLPGCRAEIAAMVASGDAGRQVLALGGLAFLIVGFGFKVALVPFHAWAGDVYQGAPTPITALLGVGSKAAGLAGLLRILADVFPALPGWTPVLAVLAALTLVVGNSVAMLQDDLKRLLAYSGISHVGFLLMGVIAHGRLAPGDAGSAFSGPVSPVLAAVLYHVVAYGLATLAALAVVALVERERDDGSPVLDYAGLGARRPLLAATMLVSMLSLAGMPPLAGFVGKWLLFQAALSAGLAWLAVVAAITSVIAFYYYLRVVLQMYLRPAREGEPEPAAASPGTRLVLAACVAATFVLGLLPWLVLEPLGSVIPAVAGR